MPPLDVTAEPTPDAIAPWLDPARKLHHLDCVTTNTADNASPELANGHSSPMESPALTAFTSTPSTPSLSRREYCISESGSPTRVQSPLRHSVSYTERPSLPFPFPNSEAATTDPTKSPSESVSRMSLTGDRRRRGAQPGWLSSAALSMDISSEATPSRLRTPSQTSATEPSISPKTASTTPTSASRFSFFSTAFKGLTSSPTTPSRSIDDSDDLISLNIDQTLHSMTSLTDRSAFSPAAFKNLQMIATGLLHKFQDAYTQRTLEVRELRAEQAAQADEQSEAETKMQHLRMQLEGMAQKAAKQEEMMQALMAELAREKKLRMEQTHPVSGGSSISEDLGAEEDQRKKWRKSNGTSRSDTSFDTDDEGAEEGSLFSTRSRSPTIATVLSEAGAADAPTAPAQAPLVTSKAASLVASPRTPRPPQSQMTAFQKLFKGLSVESPKDSEAAGPDSCRNCQGQDVGVAWDTVSLLKDENKGLKQRVGDLEGALEDALDVVNGVGM